MPIAFDSTGYVQQDQHNWRNPVTGDGIGLLYFNLVPDLPAGLDDLPRLRHELAVIHAEDGCLIEAHVVQLGGVPALLRIMKMPLPNRHAGQLFACSFTIPKANASVVLQLVAPEGPMSGLREAALVPEVGWDRWVMPHPYAPQVQGRLPFHAGDDPRFDSRFPDHPLTRARAWAHHIVRTARVDPQFAALPPFQPAAPAPVRPTAQAPAPAPPPTETGGLVTALPGVPIAGHIALRIGDRTTYWRMPDDVLTDQLGRGLVQREALTDARDREALLIDEASGEVRIPNRYLTDGGRSEPRTKLVPVTQQEAEAAATPEACAEAFKRVGVLADRGAGRREDFTVEPIDRRGDRVEPFCLLTVQVREGKEVVAVVAYPAPQESPFEGRTTLDAPATLEAVEQFGGLVLQVVHGWGVHPLLTALVYKHRPTPTPVPVPAISPQDLFNANLSGAACGVPIANHIALQIGERTTYWKMLDNHLYSRLGQGDISRSAVSDGRFREMIMIDESTGNAMIMDRFTTNGSQLGINTQLQQVTKEEAYLAVHLEASKQAYRWVGRMIEVADGRREYLTLEPIVNQGEKTDPIAMLAMRYENGEDIVLVSCSPNPSERTPFKGSAGLNAPTSLKNIESIGEMAMYAMYEWGPHPLEMAITFNRYAGSLPAQGLSTLTDDTRAMFAGTLTPVVPGIPVGGYVALQDGEQRSYWRMPDSALHDKLGRGAVVRTYLQDHRYRDEVLLDYQSGELLVPNRYSDDGSTTGTKTTLVRVSPEEAMAAATPEACHEAYEWLGRWMYSAMKRGEFLFAELLENTRKQEPYAVLAVKGPVDDRIATVFATPAPSANTPFNNLPGLEGPASPENIVGLGSLTLKAVNDWGVHPLHMAVTYFRPSR